MVATLTALVYLPALQLSWIWDDDQYVFANPLLQSWNGLYRIWFEPSASPQYYPVVFSVLWMEYQLFGANPFGFHLVNILLHATGAVVCYLILRRLKLPAAFWIALAFGIHPIQVESVAWVTELKNVLSGVFYGCAWLTLWPLLGGEPSPTSRQVNRDVRQRVAFWRTYLCGTLLFVLALLSKSVTATLPAGMLVALWFREGRLRIRQVAVVFPLLVAGGALGWNTARMEREHVGALGSDWDYGFADRIGIASRSILHYSVNIAVPWEQMFFYPRFSTQLSNPANLFSLVLCLVLALLFSGLAWKGIRGPLACACFFVGSAFPALGFLNVYPHRFSLVADHFVYIPSVGLFCLSVSTVYWLVTRMKAKLRTSYQQLVLAPMLILFGWYAFSTFRYLPAYSNEITLWEDTLAKNSACPAAMQNLGLEYLRAGRLDDSLAVLRQAAQYDFDRHQTMNSLGLVYGQLGRIAEAKQAFTESARLRPDSPRAWINLANLVWSSASDDSLAQARTEAKQYYRTAWEIHPEYRAAFGLGMLDYEEGQFQGAAEWFAEASRIQPGDLDARFNRAQVLFELGELELAAEECERLLENFPRDNATNSLLRQIRRSQQDQPEEDMAG